MSIHFHRRRAPQNIQQDLHTPLGGQHPQNDRLKSTERSLHYRYFRSRKQTIFHREWFFGVKTLSQFFNHGAWHSRDSLSEMHEAADPSHVANFIGNPFRAV